METIYNVSRREWKTTPQLYVDYPVTRITKLVNSLFRWFRGTFVNVCIWLQGIRHYLMLPLCWCCRCVYASHRILLRAQPIPYDPMHGRDVNQLRMDQFQTSKSAVMSPNKKLKESEVIPKRVIPLTQESLDILNMK